MNSYPKLQGQILLCCHIKNDFLYYLKFADFMRDKSQLVFYFLIQSEEELQYVPLIESHGHLVVMAHRPLRHKNVTKNSNTQSTTQSIKNPDSSSELLFFLKAIYLLLKSAFYVAPRLIKKKWYFRRILKPLNFSCAISAQERILSLLPVYKALEELHVPMVLMPVSYSLTEPDGGATMRVFQKRFDLFMNSETSKNPVGFLNKLIAKIFPEQVFDSRYGKMFFMHYSEIISLYFAGMLVKNLWYQGTRFSDYILISGNDERLACQNAKISPSKIKLLGSMVLDGITHLKEKQDAIRSTLIDKYQLHQSEKILIISLAPMFEHDLLSWADHTNYLNEVLTVAKRCTTNVLISLHPKMKSSFYLELSKKYNTPIIEEPLHNVLVGTHAFVASAYSSTIRWGLAVGIPTINLDFWNLLDSTYIGLKDYPNVLTLNDFESKLKEMLTTNQENVTLQKNYFGLLADGKFFDRAHSFLYEVCNHTSF